MSEFAAISGTQTHAPSSSVEEPSVAHDALNKWAGLGIWACLQRGCVGPATTSSLVNAGGTARVSN
jgi:hypothetical protein